MLAVGAMTKSLSDIRIEPRGLSRDNAAAYCGCDSLSAFDDWVRRGIVPGPIVGTKRWDRRAIDAALDKRSGLHLKSGADRAASAYDEWRTECESV
jgi:hypothetical protein